MLRIGTQTIKMPMDWQILIGEPDVGDLEVLPLTSINDRGFKVFQFNPLSSYRPSFPDIEILDVYHEVNWYAPKLKNGQMLVANPSATAATYTLPLGTAIDAAVPNATVGSTFDLSIVNIGTSSGAVTLAAQLLNCWTSSA